MSRSQFRPARQKSDRVSKNGGSSEENLLRLRILLPARILFDDVVTKVSSESQAGAFTLLPRHIDFVTALVPGLLSCETRAGEELFFAINTSILTKCVTEVLVSTQDAVRGPDLGTLQQRIREWFRHREEREQRAEMALSRLEADFVRRYLEVEESSYA